MSQIAKRTRSSEEDSSIRGDSKRRKKVLEGVVILPLPSPKSARSVKVKSDIYKKHGATVVEGLNGDVTHIVVPKTYTQKYVENKLGKQKIPEHVEIVTDEWPSTCISRGEVVDVTNYRVAGGSIDGTSGDSGSRTVELDQPEEDKDSREAEKGPNKKEIEETRPISDLEDAIEINKMERHASELVSDVGEASDTDDEDSTRTKSKLKGDWSGYLNRRTTQDKESNPNHYVIALFTLMMDHYEKIGDPYRKLAYRKAISTLESQTKHIKTAAEARKLSGIGHKLAGKIEEINKTGHMKKLDMLREDDGMARCMAEFKKIYGVGNSIARDWYNRGLRTLDDVKQKIELTETQRIGLEHVEDFNTPFPRTVVEQHGKIVRSMLNEVDPKVISYITGSYRRGQDMCKDIDFVLTKEGATIEELQSITGELVSRLMASGFIQCQLAGSADKTRRWLGASKVDGDPRWRRLDFLVVPWSELGSSMIYYTGNDLLNRSIRLLATRKGMRLNQHGLFWDVNRDPNVDPPKEHLIESHDEKRIFEILGVPYRDPTERNVG